MRGMDFNTGDGIGGITKILMAAYGWKIKDVAEHFGTWLEKQKTEPPMNPINPALAQPQPNTPNTCLLYTSPSPRDRTRSRMPSSA